jgi:hypothetical protein
VAVGHRRKVTVKCRMTVTKRFLYWWFLGRWNLVSFKFQNISETNGFQASLQVLV